jgi:hypothetical protein
MHPHPLKETFRLAALEQHHCLVTRNLEVHTPDANGLSEGP